MNILFDLDGTLIDCRPRLYRLFRDICRFEELSFDTYWSYRLAGRNNRWIIENIVGSQKISPECFALEWLDRVESDAYLAIDRPYTWSNDILSRVSHGNVLYLCTARRDAHRTKMQLTTMGLAHHFTRQFIAGPHRRKIDMIDELQKVMRPGDLVVGDTEEDVAIGRSLGIRAITVLTGVRDEARLKLCRPDRIYGDLREVEYEIEKGGV